MPTFNIYTLNSLLYVGLLVAVRLWYQADIKLAVFWSQLEASRMSSHNDELWYNETVFLWMTIYIYIYIYIYIHLYDIIVYYIHMLLKKKIVVLPTSHHQMMRLGVFQSQSIITTNPECSSSTLQYHLTLLFSCIILSALSTYQHWSNNRQYMHLLTPPHGQDVT